MKLSVSTEHTKHQLYVGGSKITYREILNGKPEEVPVKYLTAITQIEDTSKTELHLLAVDKAYRGPMAYKFFNIEEFSEPTRIYLRSSWEFTAKYNNFRFVDGFDLSDEKPLEYMLRLLEGEVQ